MSEHLTRLQSRIREAGMNKVASVIAAMPPRQRLLTRVCLTKNAGLLDSVLNWASANPELAGALAVGGPAAIAAAAASRKNKLRNALLLGGGAGILGAAGGSAYRNRDKIKEALGKKAPAPEAEKTADNVEGEQPGSPKELRIPPKLKDDIINGALDPLAHPQLRAFYGRLRDRIAPAPAPK